MSTSTKTRSKAKNNQKDPPSPAGSGASGDGTPNPAPGPTPNPVPGGNGGGGGGNGGGGNGGGGGGNAPPPGPGGGGGGGPPGPPAAAAAVIGPARPFALTPAQINPALYIDYSTQTGMKLFRDATSPLTYIFDLSSKNVNIFCEKLHERAEKSGWLAPGGNVLDIPDDDNVPRNLITEYGRLTMENVDDHVQTFFGNQSRQAQNDIQVFHCLSSSLTQEATDKMVDETDEYTIGDTPVGIKYLKHMLDRATVDTRSTASHLRKNLTDLDSYMATINSNIEEFNNYVKINQQGLKARGERTDDLMINLFKGYAAARDATFVKYIATKQDAYDEGDTMTTKDLMRFALNRYKNRVRDGTWGAPTAEEKRIVALSSTLNKLKDQNLQLSKSIDRGGRGRGRGGKGNKGEGGDRANSEEQASTATAEKKERAWMLVAPKDGEKHEKSVPGFKGTMYWCPEHKKWGGHKLDKCKKRQDRLDKEKKGNDASKDRQSQRNQAYAATLTSIMEDLNDSDSD